jgi:3-hydroxyacyl-CoA dehydrogenase / 3-hydroxy-2-methylbutyryl-CoA dehydrogenase
MQLNQVQAIVTGGASGLGEATVRRVVAGGGQVAILDRNAERGIALAAELGPRTLFCAADITSEADVAAAIAQTDAAFGGLNAVVNCAGIAPPAKTVGRQGPHPLDLFEQVIRVNLIGTFNVIRLAAARMVVNTPNADGERGVIVNTASVAAYDGQVGQAAYSASKGGIVAMTLPIARDLAREGVRVVTIAPGIFDTPLMASLPEAARESLGQQVPFPSRLGRPSEYAQMVVAVLENAMLNGETIRLDGAIRMAPR